ncbi:hypothetical protein FRIGORI9N_280008 [Frigoribacterium sp. 9N]|nr:hypothetical protein FRIGORI9N_280008 [Frigoribacterium sp. 9N]
MFILSEETLLRLLNHLAYEDLARLQGWRPGPHPRCKTFGRPLFTSRRSMMRCPFIRARVRVQRGHADQLAQACRGRRECGAWSEAGRRSGAS